MVINSLLDGMRGWGYRKCLDDLLSNYVQEGKEHTGNSLLGDNLC